MKNKTVALVLPLVVLAIFGGWSTWIMATAGGYVGFVRLVAREPWAAQLLVDVALASFLYSTWMVRDARARGLPVAPYLVMMLIGGSIGALAYLVHRADAEKKKTTDAPETPVVSVRA